MPVVIRGRIYDFAAECLECPNEFQIFATQQERDEWLKSHKEHEVDVHLQGRV
jgi:hypothetical protein